MSSEICASSKDITTPKTSTQVADHTLLQAKATSNMIPPPDVYGDPTAPSEDDPNEKLGYKKIPKEKYKRRETGMKKQVRDDGKVVWVVQGIGDCFFWSIGDQRETKYWGSRSTIIFGSNHATTCSKI